MASAAVRPESDRAGPETSTIYEQLQLNKIVLYYERL